MATQKEPPLPMCTREIHPIPYPISSHCLPFSQRAVPWPTLGPRSAHSSGTSHAQEEELGEHYIKAGRLRSGLESSGLGIPGSTKAPLSLA